MKGYYDDLGFDDLQMLRRPNLSENELQKMGNMDIESIYIAIERLVIVSEALRSLVREGRAALSCQWTPSII